MTTIWYNDIENVLISLTDPNTWGATYEVPWVSSPKINGSTSIYNVEASGTGIAWWSTDINWSASDKNTVAWSTGSIYLPDDYNNLYLLRYGEFSYCYNNKCFIMCR